MAQGFTIFVPSMLVPGRWSYMVYLQAVVMRYEKETKGHWKGRPPEHVHVAAALALGDKVDAESQVCDVLEAFVGHDERINANVLVFGGLETHGFGYRVSERSLQKYIKAMEG